MKSVEDRLSKIDEELKLVKQKSSENVSQSNSLSNSERKVTNVHECKKCDAKFHAKENLKYHITTKHPSNITCKICDMYFRETTC